MARHEELYQFVGAVLAWNGDATTTARVQRHMAALGALSSEEQHALSVLASVLPQFAAALNCLVIIGPIPGTAHGRWPTATPLDHLGAVCTLALLHLRSS